jgi:hypothetical protein
MTVKPTFTPTITLGNLLTLGMLIVSVTMAWSELRSADAAQTARLDEMQRGFEASLVETRRVRPEYETRLRSLEAGRAADATEIAALRRDMADLRTDLREAIALLRQIRGAGQ